MRLVPGTGFSGTLRPDFVPGASIYTTGSPDQFLNIGGVCFAAEWPVWKRGQGFDHRAAAIQFERFTGAVISFEGSLQLERGI